jgi:membrane-associated protease RseP (regulator of RpoE activity)
MWRFNLFGFPVTVEPWFWLSCFLLGSGVGGRGREGITLILLWTVVVFISITIHELGHAFAARKQGAHPEIRLQGLGGVTLLHGGYLDRWQSIFVSAAGPLASLALGGFVWLVDRAYPAYGFTPVWAVHFFLWVNFFWTGVNLLPVLPLDGGQIVRDLLGPRRAHISLWLGVVCGAAVGVLALTRGYLFLAIMMFLLAFTNFQRRYVGGGVVRN